MLNMLKEMLLIQSWYNLTPWQFTSTSELQKEHRCQNKNRNRNAFCALGFVLNYLLCILLIEHLVYISNSKWMLRTTGNSNLLGKF